MPHNAHQIGIEGVLALWELERLAARHHLLPITERERETWWCPVVSTFTLRARTYMSSWMHLCEVPQVNGRVDDDPCIAGRAIDAAGHVCGRGYEQLGLEHHKVLCAIPGRGDTVEGHLL